MYRASLAPFRAPPCAPPCAPPRVMHRAPPRVMLCAPPRVMHRAPPRVMLCAMLCPSLADERRVSDEDADADSSLLVKERTRLEPPSLYKVILLNDDYTPMEFVVGILEALFSRSRQEAVEIMFHVHNKGVGVCGLYPHGVAETKATQVMSLARKNEHPLQCVIEKEVC